MSNMITTFIYSLNEPNSQEVRYIGKSNDPKKRFTGHCNNIKKQYYKRNWIKSLKDKGQKPDLNILLEIRGEDWEMAEKIFIKTFKKVGFRLTNDSLGGNGELTMSEETKKKISIANSGPNNGNFGKKLSMETRRKMSIAGLGSPDSKEAKDNKRKSAIEWWSKNTRTLSEEAKKNQSIAQKIHWSTHKKVVSSETKSKLSEAMNKRWKQLKQDASQGNEEALNKIWKIQRKKIKI